MTNKGFLWFSMCVSLLAGAVAMALANSATGGPGVWVPTLTETILLGSGAAAVIFALLWWARFGGAT